MSESYPQSQERIGAELENFVQATTDALESANANSEAIEAVEEAGEEITQRVDQLEQEVQENSEEIEASASELDDHEKRITALGSGIEYANGEIERLEEEVQSQEATGSAGEEATPTGHVTPETPLEQVTALPQEMVDDESANVQRAVFVASGVNDYTRKVPAGRAIKSSELRRVLKAGTDCHGHTETVSRVMSVLDDMGGEGVKIVDRRGEKRVVFEESVAERLTELVEQKQSTNHAVVTQTEV